MNLNFFFEVLIGGLLSGVMYALVALGFVLIYKASGVFNFAQGAMVFFAALTCVSLVNHWGFPLWVAILTTIATMAVLGVLIERIVLRPLVNQPEISLFMATIGLSFFIEGMAQLMWGAEVQRLDLGIEDVPMESLLTNFNIIVSKFDVVAACICAILVTCLALFFSRTKIGRALRAVADDHSFATYLGHCVGSGWLCCYGGWFVMGFTQWRAILSHLCRSQSLACTHTRWFHFSTWRHHWRSHHRFN
jgi:branched-chain amino acid transport system permease protein